MLFASVTKHTELCAPFFKLLTLLTETQGGPVGLPCFTQLVLPRMWDAAEYCPQSVLDWLSLQATKNKIAHAWILQSAEQWLEQFLLAHDNTRVRNGMLFNKDTILNDLLNIVLISLHCSCCLPVGGIGAIATVPCQLPCSFTAQTVGPESAQLPVNGNRVLFGSKLNIFSLSQ